MDSQKWHELKYQEFIERLLLKIISQANESDNLPAIKWLDKVIKNRLYSERFLLILQSTCVKFDENSWVCQGTYRRRIALRLERRMGKYHDLLERRLITSSSGWDNESILQGIEMEIVKKWLYKQGIYFTQLPNFQKWIGVSFQQNIHEKV